MHTSILAEITGMAHDIRSRFRSSYQPFPSLEDRQLQADCYLSPEQYLRFHRELQDLWSPTHYRMPGATVVPSYMDFDGVRIFIHCVWKD